MLKHHLAFDTIDTQDIDALAEWLKGNPRLTKGSLTVEFEQKYSEWLGKDYSVFSNSGSSANLLMYYALLLSGKAKNKKVIVPATGWVTSIAPAIQFGFEPIMCEADQDTFGLDLTHLETLLKEHDPGAVLLVQVLGVPHKMEALMALKEKYEFILMEDTCAAIGSTYQGRKLGTYGDMSSFSFYYGHQMSTIEGGITATNDPEFRDLLLMARSHGWSKDLTPEGHQQLVDKYAIDDFNSPFVFYIPGFNVRSTDLNAFIGLRQVAKLDQMAECRNENHQRYRRHLGDTFTVQTWDDPQARVSSIHFCLLAESAEQRKAIVRALTDNHIETRLFTAGNLGLHPFWFERYGKPDFKWANELHARGFFLPNHATLKPEDVDYIARIVQDAAC